MALTRKLMLNGEPVDAVELPFEVLKEPWSEYELLDGGKLRVRNIVVRIWMVVDPAGKMVPNAEGEPTVIVHTQTVNVVLSR